MLPLRTPGLGCVRGNGLDKFIRVYSPRCGPSCTPKGIPARFLAFSQGCTHVKGCFISLIQLHVASLSVRVPLDDLDRSPAPFVSKKVPDAVAHSDAKQAAFPFCEFAA